jgi:cobalamin 5'-phosphate synthase/cobalamin synthase
VKPFLAAVAFLTRLPIGNLTRFDARDVAHSAGWFPVVGILLGSACAGVAALFRGHLPSGVIAALLIAFDAVATGALHFDGLADTADGFGGGNGRDDVLRIMRDHAVGSYGALALAALVALKLTAYTSLLQRNDWPQALIFTPMLGRWSILLLTAALPYARPTESPADGMGKFSLLQGTAAASLALIAARSLRGWVAAGAVGLVTTVFGFWCHRRIAGVTGDTLGANLQLCESASLIAFLFTLSPQ